LHLLYNLENKIEIEPFRWWLWLFCGFRW